MNKNSQYDPGLIVKEVHDFFGQSVRTSDSRSVADQFYTHFRVTYNGTNPTQAIYYRGTNPHKTEVGCVSDSAQSLAGKYFTLYSAPDNAKYYVWYRVSGAGTDPALSGATGIVVDIQTNDNAQVVALATTLTLSATEKFTATRTSAVVEIFTTGMGVVTDSAANTSGFAILNTAGTQVQTNKIDITYDGTDPVYQGQTLKGMYYNVYTGKFEKNNDVTIDNAEITVALDSANDSVSAVQSGAWTVAVNNLPSTQAISAAALPLPAGAATSALQTTGNTSLTNINNKLPTLIASRIPVDGSGVTQPISAAALPLPTGATTAALQTAGNASLSSVDAKLPALITGRVPVDGSAVVQPISATALPLPAGAATSSNQTTTNTSLSTITNNVLSFEDFGTASNLAAALNSAVTYTNTYGLNSVSFNLTIPTGATVAFETTVDGTNWSSCTLRQKGGDNYITSTTISGEVIGSISGVRQFRVRVSVAGSAAGTVMGRVSREVNTLEGIENGPPNEFFFDVSRGKIGGINGATRFARNPDIDMVKETIWALGGTYTFSTVAASYYISSTSAADTQVITVTVLDGNFVPTTRTVTLVGQTKTLIPGGTILRINGAANTGSVDLVGSVYIYEDDTVVAGVPQTAAKIRNFIPQLEQNSGIGVYTVAAGQTAYLVKWQAQCSTGTADVTMDVKQFGSVFRNRGRKLIGTTGSSEYKVFLRIPEKSDIRFEASTSANNTVVLVEYDLILVDN